MNPELKETLHLALRWIHIFAAITWVGTTYFFTWLDGQFSVLEKDGGKDTGKDGAKANPGLWMVHSGGFYLIEKQKRPQLMPQVLHWFKWESAITWISGILLLGLLYYHGSMMVDAEDSKISNITAVWVSVGLLLGGWVVYDFLWRSPLCKNEYVGIVISFLLIAVLAYGLSKYFSTRAVYMQVGAMFGTLMTANVWMRILPPQRRMVAALKEGREPDLTEAVRAKTRSKHNTFIVQAVIFLMVSNHFPTLTYGNPYSWQILCGMVLLGWGVAAFVRRLG
jgi:uncharacterized membrane protein